jgi:secreted PhoX family phosphatase
MTLDALSRRRFIQGATAAGGGLAMGGPLSALTAQTAGAKQARRAPGYGPLSPTPEKDSGRAYLALPKGFEYRIVNRSYEPSIAYPTQGSEPTEVPTPTTFDGMAAFAGPRGSTILVRNHENRGDDGEQAVIVPEAFRYDEDPRANGGLTRLVVGPDRRLAEPPLHLLGGTSTNCAGGPMPWGSWITCEETETTLGERHGYIFEAPADADGPVPAIPVPQAGRFSHEAVAWLDGVLYETEDVREQSCFYRYRPRRRIDSPGDLANSSGPLEALAIEGMPGADGDTLEVGRAYPVTWVPIGDPDPADGATRTRQQGRSQGAVWFDRLEGCWESDGRILFDATEGGKPDVPGSSGTATTELGQLFEYDPRRKTLTLVFESPAPEVLQNPDNLVIVPHTGHVFLQEDSPGEQFVRGVTRGGEIYDVARTLINDSEFCGGCFSPDGRTFFLNQQGGEANTPDDSERGLTYAIWGPFDRAGAGRDNGNGKGKDDDRGRGRG